MAIQMLGALMSVATQEQDGHFYIIDPTGPITIPASARKAIEEGKAGGIRVELPEGTHVTMILFGGKPHQSFTFGFIMAPPQNMGVETTLENRPLTWGSGPTYRIHVQARGHVLFREPAIYTFKFLIDGVPVGELPCPIIWDDHVNQ